VAKKPSTPADQEAYLRNILSKLTYEEWDGPGHFLMMEQPERFNQLLLRFLSTVR